MNIRKNDVSLQPEVYNDTTISNSMKYLKLGDYNTLKVVKEVDFGVYLDGGDEGEILLPKRYVPEGCRKGDDIEVFLYLDIDERMVATTEHPLVRVGEFAFLEVAWVNQYGAFLKWGLMKDLFCPFREQKQKMDIGESYIVYATIDEESYRIMASAKVEHFLSKDKPQGYAKNQEADLLVWQKTDLGFKVIVDNKYSGLIYRDQIFRPIHTGDRLKGYIVNVRDDGKIDLALQPTGRRETHQLTEQIEEYLQSHGGECPLGDKSDAQDIYDTFHCSKKAYKKAIGDLYKRRMIDIDDRGIHLIIFNSGSNGGGQST